MITRKYFAASQFLATLIPMVVIAIALANPAAWADSVLTGDISPVGPDQTTTHGPIVTPVVLTVDPSPSAPLATDVALPRVGLTPISGTPFTIEYGPGYFYLLDIHNYGRTIDLKKINDDFLKGNNDSSPFRGTDGLWYRYNPQTQELIGSKDKHGHKIVSNQSLSSTFNPWLLAENQDALRVQQAAAASIVRQAQQASNDLQQRIAALTAKLAEDQHTLQVINKEDRGSPYYDLAVNQVARDQQELDDLNK